MNSPSLSHNRHSALVRVTLQKTLTCKLNRQFLGRFWTMRTRSLIKIKVQGFHFLKEKYSNEHGGVRKSPHTQTLERVLLPMLQRPWEPSTKSATDLKSLSWCHQLLWNTFPLLALISPRYQIISLLVPTTTFSGLFTSNHRSSLSSQRFDGPSLLCPQCLQIQWLTSWPANLHQTQRTFLYPRLLFLMSSTHEPEHEESQVQQPEKNLPRTMAQSPSSSIADLLKRHGEHFLCKTRHISIPSPHT